jgi:RNA polymerase sigma-70 factor (ECF subfamily)
VPAVSAESKDAEAEGAPGENSASSAATATESADDTASARDIRDRRLVRRLKQGDHRAFEEMVRTYQDRIFGLVYRMIGNRQEAEDVAQEVFISVYRNIESYRGDGRLYTWLYRIASNTCKNRLKYLKTRQFHRGEDLDQTPAAHLQAGQGSAMPSLSSDVPGPEAAVEAGRLEKLVQREIGNLEAEHRLLIVLRDIQGLSYQDILKITGLQEGTLKSRLHRARVALKERLAEHLR